jgi:hypothetical protein
MEVSLFEDALPAALYSRLVARFVDGDSVPFVSVSRWFALDREPRLAIEQAMLVIAGLLPDRARVAGGEWFLRESEASLGMAWHYDLDRDVLQREERHVHPTYSSLLYFDSFGGPTIVADQLRGDDRDAGALLAPPSAVAVLPAPNRLVSFPGDRLHAVASIEQPGRRLTLSIHWWPSKPAAPFCLDSRYGAPELEGLAALPPFERGSARRGQAIALDGARLSSLPHRNRAPVWRPA